MKYQEYTKKLRECLSIQGCTMAQAYTLINLVKQIDIEDSATNFESASFAAFITTDDCMLLRVAIKRDDAVMIAWLFENSQAITMAIQAKAEGGDFELLDLVRKYSHLPAVREFLGNQDATDEIGLQPNKKLKKANKLYAC